MNDAQKCPDCGAILMVSLPQGEGGGYHLRSGVGGLYCRDRQLAQAQERAENAEVRAENAAYFSMLGLATLLHNEFGKPNKKEGTCAWACQVLRKQKVEAKRLREENAALNVALFHVENGLAHPDPKVRALIKAALAASEGPKSERSGR